MTSVNSGTDFAERRRQFLEKNRQKNIDQQNINNLHDQLDHNNSINQLDQSLQNLTKKDSFSNRLNISFNQNMLYNENETSDVSNTKEETRIKVLTDHKTVFPKSKPLFHQIIMAKQNQPLKVNESDVISLMNGNKNKINRLGSQTNSVKTIDSRSMAPSIQSEIPAIQDLSSADEDELTGTFLSKVSDDDIPEEETMLSVYESRIENEDDHEIDEEEENQSTSYFDIGELEIPTNYKLNLKK